MPAELPSLALLAVPFAGAIGAFAVRSSAVRPWILPSLGAVQMGLTLSILWSPAAVLAGGWLLLDPLAKVVLLAFNTLFLFIALYAPAYLRVRSDRPNRVFVTCLFLLQGMAQVVIFSHHLGLMWVAVEAMSLASGPLLYFARTARSIEATWKYLLVSSVGIAIALLGTFFMAFAGLQGAHLTSLLLEDVLREASRFSRPWLHAAFVTLLVGYGTKVGLAPLHTWKPDAYGEAPGMIGGLLAGGVTACAFLALLRFAMLMKSAGESAVMQQTLLGAGLLSMAFAAVFVVRQRDLKRLLAYSSVEHMGILVFGIGIGGVAVFGALLHLLFNSLGKGAMFIVAGNIHRAYGSKSVDDVSGVLRRLPVSGALLLGGFIAMAGSPPFGPFRSEFTILRGAFEQGHFAVAGGMLVLLMAIFVGMGSTVLGIAQGHPSPGADSTAYRDTAGTVLSPLFLMGIVLVCGIYLPGPLDDLVAQAAAYFERPL